MNSLWDSQGPMDFWAYSLQTNRLSDKWTHHGTAPALLTFSHITLNYCHYLASECSNSFFVHLQSDCSDWARIWWVTWLFDSPGLMNFWPLFSWIPTVLWLWLIVEFAYICAQTTYWIEPHPLLAFIRPRHSLMQGSWAYVGCCSLRLLLLTHLGRDKMALNFAYDIFEFILLNENI